MTLWEQLEKAEKYKARILVLTDSGIIVEGIFCGMDNNGNFEIKTDTMGTMTVLYNKVTGISVLDNLDLVERMAHKKGLV